MKFLPDLKSLPPEVLESINKRIDLGEKVTACIQFGWIFFIFIIWLISPKALDASKSFEAIPILIGFYTPILSLRLYWAFKKEIPETTSILFSIIDIAAIMSLIFFYHIQYMQVPSLSLKSPTFVLLFVIIATRTLSFRPSLIITTTFSSVVLWLALTIYSLNHESIEVTRSFVEYFSSAKVLIGAEVEKILALILMGFVLTLAVRNSMITLMESIVATEQRKSLSLFFSPEIEEKIRNGLIEYKPGHGETRTAAVMFIDLRGFTKLSEKLEPNFVLSILKDYTNYKN